MQISVTKKWFRPSFWLSLILHLLALIYLLMLMMSPTEKTETKKKPPQQLPHHYVPAYTYTGSIKPSTLKPSSSVTSKKTLSSNESNTPAKNITKPIENLESAQQPDHPQGQLHVQKATKKTPITRYKPQQQSMLAASFDALKEDHLKEISKAKESEPIYLIGDDSHPADPLIKLLGRSLSAHFGYPRTAGELGVRGKVIIELTLHPEGYISSVQMLKSSGSEDLDAAALYAVNSAPTIVGADRYIIKPRHFVIGFVFY